MKASWSRWVMGSVCLLVLVGVNGCARKPGDDEAKDTKNAKEAREEVLAGRIPMSEVAIEIVPPEEETAEPARPRIQVVPPPAPPGDAEEKPQARPAPLRFHQPRPVILFGTGACIWDGKEQFALTTEQVRGILKDLPLNAFKRPSKVEPDTGSRSVEDRAAPAIGRPEGGRREPGVAMPGLAQIRPGHVRVVIKGISTGMEFTEMPAPISAAYKLAMRAVSDKSVKTDSLADALKKLDKKELAIETLHISIPDVSIPGMDKKKIKDGAVTTRSLHITGLGLDGVMDGVPLPVARKALEDALRVLIDNDAGSLPEGLVGDGKVDPFGVRVLNQQRQFDLMAIPERPRESRVQGTPEQVKRVKAIREGLQKVGQKLLENVPNLPAEPPAQVSPENPGPPAVVVPDEAK